MGAEVDFYGRRGGGEELVGEVEVGVFGRRVGVACAGDGDDDCTSVEGEFVGRVGRVVCGGVGGGVSGGGEGEGGEEEGEEGG